MKKKDQHLKIAFLGDKGTGKTTFIDNYKTTCTVKQQKKEIYQTLKKELANQNFHLLIYEFDSSNDDKIQQLVAETCCVFIIFDLTNRDTFNNLLNKWLIWLRDVLKYQGQVFILGNIKNKEKKFLCTDEEEIQELINVSEVPAQYFEIGNLSDEKKNDRVDQLILEAEKEKEKRTDGSKDKNCIIF